MKNKINTIIAIACFTLATIPAAMAKQHHNFEHSEMGIYKQLDLNKQQKQDIELLIQQTRENNQLIAGEKHAIKAQMNNLMTMPHWDEAAAKQIIIQQIQQTRESELNRAQTKHKVYLLLNDTQKMALNEKIQNTDSASNKRGNKGANKKERKFEKRMAKKLDLSKQQIAQIKAIKAASMTQLDSIKSQEQAFRAAQRQLIQAQTFDESAWLALQQQHADTVLTHKLIKTKARYDRFSLLSDEQKIEMENMQNKMKEKKRRHSTH